MLKFFTALIIISGLWCIGQSKNVRMQARIAALWRFLDGLSAMESEIRGLCAPLPAAFERAARLDPIFAAAARYGETEDAESAFCHAVAEAALHKEESDILTSFAAGLSAEEQAGQLQNISHCRARITALCQSLTADTARLGRLYSGTGALAGVLIVILLL